MSEEFLSVATKEVTDDINSIENILKLCVNDADVFQNASKLQKHTHKIKGLAPMMGKEPLGDLSTSLDDLFKKIIDGQQIDGVFDLILDSIPHMKKSMNEIDYDFSQIDERIRQL
ncbi:MAG: Hpt domain-containing protein [Candidatus Nitrosopumilus sp. bin_7KS]